MIDECVGLVSGSIGYLSGVYYANSFDIGVCIAHVERAMCRSLPPASFPPSGTGSVTIC